MSLPSRRACKEKNRELFALMVGGWVITPGERTSDGHSFDIIGYRNQKRGEGPAMRLPRFKTPQRKLTTLSKRRATIFKIDNSERLPTGALRVKGALTKVGVFEYQFEDTTVRELRSPEEVFSQESLDTLIGAPVTIDHPADFVGVDNWGHLAVGTVVKAQAEDPYVIGELVVHDKRAIDMIEQGKLKEISLGYNVEMQEINDSVEAEFAQCQIRYNHCALGPDNWARLGRDVALRLDSNKQLILEDFMTKTRKARKDAEPAVAEEAPVVEEIEAIEPEAPVEEVQPEVKAEEPAPEQPEPQQPEAPDLSEVHAKLDQILAMLVPAEPAKTDSKEDIESIVQKRVDRKLRAQKAFSTFFPEEKASGEDRELALRVVQHVDAEAEVAEKTTEELVDQADLAAKAAAGDPVKESNLREALFGTVTPAKKSTLSERLFGDK